MTMKENAMTEIQQTTLDRAIKLLNALPLKYAIRTDDGREFGALPIANPEPERATHKRCVSYPYGALTKGIKHYVESMAVGDVVQIPLAEFDRATPAQLQSVAAAVCGTLWGKGSYITGRTSLHIEVLRLT